MRKADGGERRKAVGDVHLDIYGIGVDPENSGGANSGEHGIGSGSEDLQPRPAARNPRYPRVAEVDRILQQMRSGAGPPAPIVAEIPPAHRRLERLDPE
jgi:hypothetical protein